MAEWVRWTDDYRVHLVTSNLTPTDADGDRMVRTACDETVCEEADEGFATVPAGHMPPETWDVGRLPACVRCLRAAGLGR